MSFANKTFAMKVNGEMISIDSKICDFHISLIILLYS